MHVSLVGSFDDDARDLKVLLELLAEIHGTKSVRKWRLNCCDTKYLGPWAVSVLYAAYLRAQQLGQHPRIRLPEGPPALKAFCVFAGLSSLFENGPAPNPEHPDCETIPIENFTHASWDRSNRIIQLLKRHTVLGAEREDQIRSCIQEIIQNIVDHSNSPVGGVMSARYFQGSAEIRIGIVDRGIGIAAKVRETSPETTSTQGALQMVIRGGFSSRSRPNNMGLGVSNLFGLISAAGGRIALFTGDAFAESRPGMNAPQICAATSAFPGTGIFFSLPVLP